MLAASTSTVAKKVSLTIFVFTFFKDEIFCPPLCSCFYFHVFLGRARTCPRPGCIGLPCLCLWNAVVFPCACSARVKQHLWQRVLVDLSASRRKQKSFPVFKSRLTADGGRLLEQVAPTPPHLGYPPAGFSPFHAWLAFVFLPGIKATWQRCKLPRWRIGRARNPHLALRICHIFTLFHPEWLEIDEALLSLCSVLTNAEAVFPNC